MPRTRRPRCAATTRTCGPPTTRPSSGAGSSAQSCWRHPRFPVPLRVRFCEFHNWTEGLKRRCVYVVLPAVPEQTPAGEHEVCPWLRRTRRPLDRLQRKLSAFLLPVRHQAPRTCTRPTQGRNRPCSLDNRTETAPPARIVHVLQPRRWERGPGRWRRATAGCRSPRRLKRS